MSLNITDHIDDRDKLTKARSSAGEEYNALARDYNYDGSLWRNQLQGGCASGWHQQTTSLNNKWHLRRITEAKEQGHNIAPRDYGGPFFSRRVSLRPHGSYPHYSLRKNYFRSGPVAEYDGILFPDGITHRIAKAILTGKVMKDAVWVGGGAMAINDLRVIGERMMLSAVPTAPAANAVVSLGELFSEGKLFNTPGAGLAGANPGGEFLNYQFGILPVVNDLQAFKEAFDDFDNILTQYYRDAEKKVRRKVGPYSIKDETTTTIHQGDPLVMVSGWPISGHLMHYSNRRRVVKKTTTRKVWYSGAFGYHVPESMSQTRRMLTEWNRVYGIAPDPADLWELLPFSWLVDWQTNSGNAIKHLFLQASEGATQLYGYVMCHTVTTVDTTWEGVVYVNDAPLPISVTWRLVDETKQRERVLPFGTTYLNKPLTARQLAILGALGIAK